MSWSKQTPDSEVQIHKNKQRWGDCELWASCMKMLEWLRSVWYSLVACHDKPSDTTTCIYISCSLAMSSTSSTNLNPNSRHGTLMKRSLRNAVHQLKTNTIEHAIGSAWGTKDVLGVEKPSPLNTWPKCPPHAAQVISIRLIPRVLSSCRFTAPGIADKSDDIRDCYFWSLFGLPSKKAGHPHPL